MENKQYSYYERKSIHSIDEIEKLIKQDVLENFDKKNKKKILLNKDKIKVYSERYLTFFTHGYRCPICGLEAKFFAKEKDKNCNVYHLNLYGVNNEGEEVLFTKDHIVPKSKGGKNNINNYITMCEKCNKEKGGKYYE